MKRLQLRKEFRLMLQDQPQLRYGIARDLMINQVTIIRWATGNSHKLTGEAFLNSFRKHTKATVELTEEVDITEPHLAE